MTQAKITSNRYKLTIEYKGTRYSGWQKQPNARTIEEELEKGFSQILQQPIDIIGQGRTDSGVHAEAQTAHVDINHDVNINKLLYGLRGVLPRQIYVWKIEKAPPDFHARFDAKTRQYRYQIITRPSPLLNDFATIETAPLDIETIKKCTQMVAGTHNFENFSKATKDQKNTQCTVEYSEITVEGFLITYRIRANRFVRHMVRRIVGTLIQAGKGSITPEYFESLLNEPFSAKSSYGLDAKGLILEKVEY